MLRWRRCLPIKDDYPGTIGYILKGYGRTSETFISNEIALLEEALRRSRTTNHGKVGAWLLSQFQQM